jgi:hypothetical protein
MRNKITKEEFSRSIQRENKKHEKKREIYGVLNLFVQTVTDIVFRARNDISSSEPVEKVIAVLEEVEQIRNYVNNCLLEIGQTYVNKPLVINRINIDLPFQRYGNYHVLTFVETEKKEKKTLTDIIAANNIYSEIAIAEI